MDEHIYVRIAYAMMLFVFMFCGCLRSCNLWGFTAGRMEDVFPARREAAAAYFSVLLLFPCLVYPVGTVDTWLLARCFWILYVPAAASLALKQFFCRTVHPNGKYLRIALAAGAPAAVLAVLLSFACRGGSSLMESQWLIYAVGTLGVLLGVYMICVLFEICGIARMDTVGRAESADIFPRHFCLAVSGISLSGLGMAWAVFIVDSPQMHAAIAAVAMLAGMGILITILHRLWKPATQSLRPRNACNAQKEGRKNVLSDAQLESIEHQIRHIVETEMLYLDPRLKRETLQKRLDINHSYLSEVFARRFGSLNSYLNLLRIEHAMRYVAEHPHVKLSEVARISGFGSMNTFYRAKKQYEQGN